MHLPMNICVYFGLLVFPVSLGAANPQVMLHGANRIIWPAAESMNLGK